VTRNASKFEKIVYRASQRDLISAGSSMKEFFNSHAFSTIDFQIARLSSQSLPCEDPAGGCDLDKP
jgi:hypothetical protein